MSGTSTLGYRAIVHHSLLEVLLLAGVPYTSAIANVMQTFILVVTFQFWRWLLVGLVFHGLLWLLLHDDPFRLYKILRALSYAPYYGPR